MAKMRKEKKKESIAVHLAMGFLTNDLAKHFGFCYSTMWHYNKTRKLDSLVGKMMRERNVDTREKLFDVWARENDFSDGNAYMNKLAQTLGYESMKEYTIHTNISDTIIIHLAMGFLTKDIARHFDFHYETVSNYDKKYDLKKLVKELMEEKKVETKEELLDKWTQENDSTDAKTYMNEPAYKKKYKKRRKPNAT